MSFNSGVIHSDGEMQLSESPTQVRELHERALQVSARYRTAEIELLNVLDLVDRHQVYLRYGFNSLFQYSVQSLGLSENVAYTFINVTRKAREVPELKREIAAGTLTVSKAKKITAVLTAKNQKTWLELAKSSSQAKLEREVARAHPRSNGQGLMKYVSPEVEISEKVTIRGAVALGAESAKSPDLRVQLQVGISEKLMLQMRRAQELKSQQSRRPATLEETLESMVELFLQKQDPLQKAKRQLLRGKVAAEEQALGDEPVLNEKQVLREEQVLRPVAVLTRERLGRRPLPAQIKHRVMLKFAGRCGHVDRHGRRCGETKFLEFHHVQSVSAGGTNGVSNLTLLCSGHHRATHLDGRISLSNQS